MSNIHASFHCGRHYIKAEALAADGLRFPEDQAALQLVAKRELKLGMVTSHMPWDNLDDEEARAAAEALLAKPHKLRNETEAKAENRARTALSRLFTKYGITNWESRGGSEEAKAARKAKAEAKAATEAKADGWVEGDKPAVQMAAYVRPTITEPATMLSHSRFVAKELAATLKLAEPVLTAKTIEAYRKAFKQLADAISNIEKLG